jgi:hypothetical protein
MIRKMEMARETERGADGDRLLLIGSLEIPSTHLMDGCDPDWPPIGTGRDTLVAHSGPTPPTLFSCTHGPNIYKDTKP